MATSPSLTPKALSKAKRLTHSFLRTHLSSKNCDTSTSTPKGPPPSNSLSGLPAEIKHVIFSLLPDAASLYALISTCSSFYHSFLDCKSSTLAQTLRNQINPILMPDALATIKSSQLTRRTIETADDVVRLHGSGEMPSLIQKPTLRYALAITEMHEHVQFFANRFVTSAIACHPVTGVPETDRSPISPSEMNRIQRTLYRFESLCNQFARRKRSRNCSGVFAINFQQFAPWENEQLACICDFLINIVSRSYRETPGHGVERITDLAHLINHFDSNPTKYITLGLAFLRRLALAQTYKERSRLLSTKSVGYKELFDHLSAPGGYNCLPLTSMDEEERRRIMPEMVEDGNSGPEYAWHWAHSHSHPIPWINTPERCDLRRWGYVMWDLNRLNGWGVLENDWRSLPNPTEQARLVKTMVKIVKDKNAIVLVDCSRG